MGRIDALRSVPSFVSHLRCCCVVVSACEEMDLRKHGRNRWTERREDRRSRQGQTPCPRQRLQCGMPHEMQQV